MAIKCEEKEQEAPTEDSASPSPLNFALFGEGYVCLPNRNVSRSTQVLVSHSSANTNSAEQNQQSPVEMDVQLGLNEPISSPQTPAFTSWPEGGATQASGYCHLPGAKWPEGGLKRLFQLNKCKAFHFMLSFKCLHVKNESSVLTNGVLHKRREPFCLVLCLISPWNQGCCLTNGGQ